MNGKQIGTVYAPKAQYLTLEGLIHMKKLASLTSFRRGFTLVEIMIVVAIIGIIIAIAVPAFLRARETARGRACQENLSKIDGAKETYALENNLGPTGSVNMTSLVLTGGTGYLKAEPECPSGGTYTVGTVATAPTCSIGTGVDYGVPHVLPSS